MPATTPWATSTPRSAPTAACCPTSGVAGEAAYGLAVGPDDKTVVGGSSADHFAFARYTTAGILDPTFGQSGKNLFDADGVDVVGALAMQRDGKILAAGASGANVVVIRLNADGEQDMTFAEDSILVVPGLLARAETGLFVDRSQALAIQDDNKILVGNFTAAGHDFGVARIDLGGSLDPTFGNDGIARADLGGSDDVDAVLIQETGEILAVGTTDAGGTPATAVVAFDRDGGAHHRLRHRRRPDVRPGRQQPGARGPHRRPPAPRVRHAAGRRASGRHQHRPLAGPHVLVARTSQRAGDPHTAARHLHR